MGKNFGSAQLKFGMDRLFTLQNLSEPNHLFGTRYIFTRAVLEIFCSVNRALVLFAIPDVTEPSPMAKGVSVVSFF